MVTCPKCKKQFSDGTKFCDSCGTKLPEISFCTGCGKPIDTNFAFCQNCGAPIAKKSAPEPKAEEPKVEAPKAEEPKVEAPIAEAPRAEEPKVEAPIAEAPGAEEPKVEAPKAEEPKVEAPIAEAPMAEEPKAAAPIAEKPMFRVVETAGAAVTAAKPAVKAKKEKKPFPVKPVLIGAAVIVVIAAVIFAVSLIPGGKKSAKTAPVFYLQDGEVYFADLKKGGEPVQLTTRAIGSGSYDFSNYFTRYNFGLGFKLSDNGKYVFFRDKAEYDEYGFSLYCKETSGLKDEESAAKIDSEVRSFDVNEDGTLVTYLKGSESSLYQYDVKKDSKEKVASDVANYTVSDDFKKIIYTTFDGSIYSYTEKNGKEKISGEGSVLEYVDEDMNTVYFLKEESLYRKAEGKDKEKIASDVSYVICIYESGEAYYMRRSEKEIRLADYITDDMKSSDDAITEPRYPDRPVYPEEPRYPYSSYDYDSWEAYEAACAEYENLYRQYEEECRRLDEEYNAAIAAYNDAYEIYNAKLSRDNLRANIESYTWTQSSVSLLWFDGEKETVITDNFANDTYMCAYKTPVIAYIAYNQSDIAKFKLNEVNDLSTFADMIRAASTSSSELYAAVEGTARVIEQKNQIAYVGVSPDGTAIYYIDDIVQNKNYGELYRIGITDGTPGEAALYDSDVYCGNIGFVNDSIVYFKDYNGGKGELYIDKNKVDYDVNAGSVKFYCEGDYVLYFVDWEDNSAYGTLKIYDGKKPEKVGDDINSYSILPDGTVIYIGDYSGKYGKGELYKWKGGKSEKLADDVVCVFPVLEEDYGFGMTSLPAFGSNDRIVGKWSYTEGEESYGFEFRDDGTGSVSYNFIYGASFTYVVSGNRLMLNVNNNGNISAQELTFRFENGNLVLTNNGETIAFTKI